VQSAIARNLYTKIEGRILVDGTNFLGIYGTFHGVLSISLEAGQISTKRQLSLVSDFLQKLFLGTKCVVLLKSKMPVWEKSFPCTTTKVRTNCLFVRCVR
jgi:hypothetical protein